MVQYTLEEPIIGHEIQTLTFPGTQTTSTIYKYYGSGAKQGYQTVHRHHDPTRPVGQQNWDTLAPQDWASGARAEYNASTDSIVTARYYY